MKATSAFIVFMVIAQGHVVGQAGVLDPTFGGDGIVTADIAVNSDLGFGVVQQPDGKVLVAGYGIDPVTGADFIVARFNIDGTPDNSFGGDGTVQSDFGSDEQARSIILQPDGKIVVSGSYNAHAFAVVRYNSDGSLDSTFGLGGMGIIQQMPGPATGYGSVLQPDGKILVCGSIPIGGDSRLGVARFNADGTPDSSFGGGWWAIQVGPLSEGRGIALQSDGKIVVCGVSRAGIDWDMAVARFDTYGYLDNSFSDNGWLVITLSAGNDLAEDVAVQPDGKIVVTGGAHVGPTDDLVTLRLNSDGSIDNTFDVDGMAITDIEGGSDGARALVLQNDGKLVVGGFATVAGNANFVLVRYNADGSLDNDFAGGAGLATVDLDGGDDYGTCVALQTDGKILVGGYGLVGTDALGVVRFDGGPMGIEEFHPMAVMLIHPNPLGDVAVVEFELAASAQLTCELFDSQGRTVHTYFSNATRATGQHRETLDLSGIAAGQYTLVLSGRTGIVGVRVIKQ